MLSGFDFLLARSLHYYWDQGMDRLHEFGLNSFDYVFSKVLCLTFTFTIEVGSCFKTEPLSHQLVH